MFLAAIEILVELFEALGKALVELMKHLYAHTADPDEVEETVDDLLEDLTEAVEEWAEEYIPKIYIAGAKDAADHVGAAEVDIDQNSDEHEDVIDSLIDDLKDDTAGILQEARRQVMAHIRRASRRAVTSALGGEPVDKDEPYFVDRAGREWDFARYEKMKLRDLVTDVFNTGSAMAALAFGSPGIKISDGNSVDTDEACKIANGQTWSVSYFLAHTKEHPNCQRRGRPLRPGAEVALDRG